MLLLAAKPAENGKAGIPEPEPEPVGQTDAPGRTGRAHPCRGRKNGAFHGRKERIPAAAAYHQRTAVRAWGDPCQQKRRGEKQ